MTFLKKYILISKIKSKTKPRYSFQRLKMLSSYFECIYKDTESSRNQKMIEYTTAFFIDYYMWEYLKERNLITDEEFNLSVEYNNRNMEIFYKKQVPKLDIPQGMTANDFLLNHLKPISEDNASYHMELYRESIDPLIKYCSECRQSFISSGEKAFLCYKCRNKRDAKDYRKNHKKKLPPKICPVCLKEFTPLREGGIYCNDTCRVSAWRKKKSIA